MSCGSIFHNSPHRITWSALALEGLEKYLMSDVCLCFIPSLKRGHQHENVICLHVHLHIEMKVIFVWIALREGSFWKGNLDMPYWSDEGTCLLQIDEIYIITPFWLEALLPPPTTMHFIWIAQPVGFFIMQNSASPTYFIMITYEWISEVQQTKTARHRVPRLTKGFHVCYTSWYILRHALQKNSLQWQNPSYFGVFGEFCRISI